MHTTLETMTAREAVRKAHHDREAKRAATGFSGMGPGPYVAQDTAKAAERADAASLAFWQGPRGQFLRSMHELRDAGLWAESDPAMSAYNRGCADEAYGVDPAEVACARKVLSAIIHPAAARALEALAKIEGA